MPAQQAFPGGADHRVAGTEGQIVEAVHLADRGEATADGGGGMTLSLAGEVGGQSGGCRRNGGEADAGAPLGKMRPVRAIGPQGGGCHRLAC